MNHTVALDGYTVFISGSSDRWDAGDIMAKLVKPIVTSLFPILERLDDYRCARLAPFRRFYFRSLFGSPFLDVANGAADCYFNGRLPDQNGRNEPHNFRIFPYDTLHQSRCGSTYTPRRPFKDLTGAARPKSYFSLREGWGGTRGRNLVMTLRSQLHLAEEPPVSG